MSLLIIAGLLILKLDLVTANAGVSQNRLLDDLFTGHTPDVRPVCDVDAPVEVQVDLAVRQIIELDEPKQILYLNTWVRLVWYDCAMVWNASNYSNIDSLVVPFGKVWSPDITLYDNGESELEGRKDYLITLTSSGFCYYNYPTIIKVLCKIDVTYFPFDTQACPLKFGSWSYHGFELNLTNKNDAGDMSSFIPNTEWDLLSLPLTRNVLYYGCCPEPYPDVTFFVTMKRKPLFYVLNLLFPCLLITAVALLGFMLPPDAGEKVSLEITVLLSLAVFLLVVSETLPATSDGFPYIGVYFAVAMILVSLSTLLTVFVLNVHYKGNLNKPVPRWLRKSVLEFLGKIVRVQNERSVYPLDSKSSQGGEDNSAYQRETYINGYQYPIWTSEDDILEIDQEYKNRDHAHCNGNGVAGGAKGQHSWSPFRSQKHGSMSSELTERPLGREFNPRPSTANSASLRNAHTGSSGRAGHRVPGAMGTSGAGGGSDRAGSAFTLAMDGDSAEEEQRNPILAVLRRQLYLLERKAVHTECKMKHDHMSGEWKRVGIVLDRVFAIVFLIIMSVSSLAILLQLSN